MGTNKDWENWGRDDPYFGVLTQEEFHAVNMSEANHRAFFRSGEEHITSLLDKIRSRFDATFSPGATLDFGCGVGRLLIPLARRSGHATGVDISPSMLAEAHRNCERMQAQIVDLIGSDDCLSKVQGEFDLVNSHIVFAHISPRRGHAIIKAMASKVRPGGFIAVQVLYSCNTPLWVRALVKLRYRLPPLNALRNMMRGRPLREPPMQLHIYNLPTLLRMLNYLGFGEALLVTDRFNNGEFDSVVVIAPRNGTV
ncbi:MAG: class I SAM-dependent methyltransferase [Rudaea sp.]